MPLVNITRKTVTTQGYQLLTPADMLAAQQYLESRGYTATISNPKINGVRVYQMQLSADTGNSAPQLGLINDWVVIENDTIANIVPVAKATVLYQLS